jgi:hypothetical protein
MVHAEGRIQKLLRFVASRMRLLISLLKARAAGFVHWARHDVIPRIVRFVASNAWFVIGLVIAGLAVRLVQTILYPYPQKLESKIPSPAWIELGFAYLDAKPHHVPNVEVFKGDRELVNFRVFSEPNVKAWIVTTGPDVLIHCVEELMPIRVSRDKAMFPAYKFPRHTIVFDQWRTMMPQGRFFDLYRASVDADVLRVECSTKSEVLHLSYVRRSFLFRSIFCYSTLQPNAGPVRDPSECRFFDSYGQHVVKLQPYIVDFAAFSLHPQFYGGAAVVDDAHRRISRVMMCTLNGTMSLALRTGIYGSY